MYIPKKKRITWQKQSPYRQEQCLSKEEQWRVPPQREKKEAEKQRRTEHLFHETLETLCCNTPNLLNFNTLIRMNAKELILINMLYTVTCY